MLTKTGEEACDSRLLQDFFWLPDVDRDRKDGDDADDVEELANSSLPTFFHSMTSICAASLRRFELLTLSNTVDDVDDGEDDDAPMMR